MKEPEFLLRVGTLVRTNDKLDLPASMYVADEYVRARRAAADAVLHGPVGGHGGDVYWAVHEDGTRAVYCFTEFEIRQPQGSSS